MDFLYKLHTFKFSPYIALIIIELCIELSECISQAEVNRHLELGKQYLAKGQLGDALSQYHLAVEGDPNNYLTYFKRGTVYLALGKANKALSDIDRTLEIKPDFTAARISRGSIHLRQAHYDLAQLDFYNVLQVDPYNPEANDLIQRIEPAKHNKQMAEQHYAYNNYVDAITYLNEVIEVSPWSPSLYEFRSELFVAVGDVALAINDMNSAAKLSNDNVKVYFKLAEMLYKNGDASNSLKSIRECLKFDPEDKQCFPFYKKVKKVEKALTEAEVGMQEKRFEDAIQAARQAIKLEKNEKNIIYKAKGFLCTSLMKNKDTDEAIRACSDALTPVDELNLNIYCDRAEAYLQNDQFEDAIRDYNVVLNMDGNFERAKEGIDKAKQWQKNSERRDYYKILGVSRDATKAEIVKAYRKAAQKWHPDNYQNDEKMKKTAENKFIDIAAAKEVLTDEEKRRQFDQGVDPLDPESNNHQNFHGGQHFQYFHNSPFQFKFHF